MTPVEKKRQSRSAPRKVRNAGADGHRRRLGRRVVAQQAQSRRLGVSFFIPHDDDLAAPWFYGGGASGACSSAEEGPSDGPVWK